jgi:hypothetical protein
MSNFKGWTTEELVAATKTQLAKRLDKVRPIKQFNSQIIDEFLALGTPESLAKTEKRMMKMLKPKQSKAQPEYKIQAAFVKEMARLFPEVMVFSDCAAHIKKNAIPAATSKRTKHHRRKVAGCIHCAAVGRLRRVVP